MFNLLLKLLVLLLLVLTRSLRRNLVPNLLLLISRQLLVCLELALELLDFLLRLEEVLVRVCELASALFAGGLVCRVRIVVSVV